jgi:phosphoribosylaminoimidazole-succinocarboxamide synthase
VPVEAVMRGYLTGVTDTSIWSRYQKGIRRFGDLKMPDGMKKNEKLPKPAFRRKSTTVRSHRRSWSMRDLSSEEHDDALQIARCARSLSSGAFLRQLTIPARFG